MFDVGRSSVSFSIKPLGGTAMPEKRILLKNCGKIDPEAIRDYEGQDGFKALEKGAPDVA